ncbi:MAG: hypothetical protein IT162_05250 [Bryobacterales bacterium]|nr:hypothetical protein [Bryobacterales bacterium]
MLDFRKSFLTLAVFAFGGATAAFGQVPLNCTAQAAGTPNIRSEGVAELVGDVLIQCNGGTPAGANENLRQVNFQVFTQPSINITSRLLNTSAGTGNFTEAVLFIDEPVENDQTLCGGSAYPSSVPITGFAQTTIQGVCGAHTGTGNGVGTYNPNIAPNGVSFQLFTPLPAGCSTTGAAAGTMLCGPTYRGNAYQARQISANSLIWQGIPFDPPGTLTTRVIRITNVRVNASQLGATASNVFPVQLFVATNASGVLNPIAVPITNPTPTVANAQPSLTFSVVDAITCLQCDSANKDFAADTTKALAAQGTKCDSVAFRLRFAERSFPSAFKRRNDAPPVRFNNPPTPIRQDRLGVIYQTESGYMKAAPNGSRWESIVNGSLVAGNTGGSLGLADHGTRLMARFSNVQNGIQVWTEALTVLNSNQAVGGTVTTGYARQAVTDPNGAGPFQPATTTSANIGGITQVSVVGGAGSAVWEVIETDTTAFERMEARVVVAYVSNTTANLPSLGTSSVNGNYAPVSTAPAASASASIPRFVDTASNVNMLTINSCRTNILFPFVSNQAGFDTGLAIANTSKDPFGTALQTGACTVNFYGTVGTSKVCLNYPSPSITGGEHFVWSLASGGAVQATAGFQGYVIAQCQFQYGHGFAFISDLGAQRLAMGYLALVMDDSIGSRTGSRSETLGH